MINGSFKIPELHIPDTVGIKRDQKYIFWII